MKRFCWDWVLIILLAIAAWSSLGWAIVQVAHAHEAPSGWTYPPMCCSLSDCRPIDEAELEEHETYWLIRPTKEVYLKPEQPKKTEEKVDHVNGVAQYSPDGLFHRCSSNRGDPDGYTYCLFVPRAGT